MFQNTWETVDFFFSSRHSLSVFIPFLLDWFDSLGLNFLVIIPYFSCKDETQAGGSKLI